MASTLDGAGQIKMATLEEATLMLQRLHGTVERMAVALKSKAGAAEFIPQVKRTTVPLAALLKPQFQSISDIATGMLLSVTRGGSDALRLRVLRESVAQLRVQIEIAVTKIKEKHTLPDEDAPTRPTTKDVKVVKAAAPSPSRADSSLGEVDLEPIDQAEWKELAEDANTATPSDPKASASEDSEAAEPSDPADADAIAEAPTAD